MIHQSPPPFAPLTSYPLVIWYPQGPVAQKVFEEPSSCRFPSRRKIITLNIFSERDSFFSFLGYIYSYLAPPSSLIPYFPCYFYSASKVIGNQREMNDSMKEKEKKTGLNINNIEFYFCFLIRGIFCEK